jgi:hypothetical protein
MHPATWRASGALSTERGWARLALILTLEAHAGRDKYRLAVSVQKCLPKRAIQNFCPEHVQVIFDSLPSAKERIFAPTVLRVSLTEKALNVGCVPAQCLRTADFEPGRKSNSGCQIVNYLTRRLPSQEIPPTGQPLALFAEVACCRQPAQQFVQVIQRQTWQVG